MKPYVAILLMFLLAAPAQASVQLPSPRTMRALEAPVAIPGRDDDVRRGPEPRRTPEFARTTGYDATMQHAGTRSCRVVVSFIGYDDRNNRTAYAPFNGTSRGFAWTYDLANRVLTERNSLNLGPTYTYDAAGRRATKLDGNLQLTTFGYDDNGRLLTVLFSDATQNEFAYDSRGNRTLEKSPTHERHLQYDELNRLKQVDDITFGRTIVYGYDANGNRTSITEGGVTQRFEYDSRNLLISAREGASPAVQLKYDALGRRTAIIRPNGVRSDFVFDDASQVSSITHSKGGVALLAFSYQYDGEGMRTRKTREDGSYEIYGYDTSRRLTSVKYSSGRNISYGLDVWGNWFDVFDSATPLSGYPSRYTTNAFNQLTRIENYGSTLSTFSYDNNGNTLTEVKGASFGGGTTTYAWTKDNRLASVTAPSGVSTFEYDANGLRTKKNESGGETRFLLDGASVLEELDSANVTVTRYLNNPQRIDEQLAFSRGGADYWPLHDALGSIVAVSDANGALISRFEYGVQGERTTLGAGPPLAFGFTGREHDAFGKRYHRDRYVDPALGAFTQPDRLGLIDGPNLYGYVRGNPVQLVDPSGRGAFDSATWRIFIALGQGDVATAMYYFSVATGLGVTSQQNIINILTGVVDAFGGGASIQVPGRCATVARQGFWPLARLMEALGLGRPYFLKIISTDGTVIGYQFRDGRTVQVATNGVHTALKVGDRVFDGFTGPGGQHVAEYLDSFYTYLGKNIRSKEYASFPSMLQELE